MTTVLPKNSVDSWSGDWLARPLRSIVAKHLARITNGSILICEGDSNIECGTSREGEPRAVIHVSRSSIWERIVFGGTVGAAESYMDGDWNTDNLVALVRIFCGNRAVMESMEGGLAWLRWPALKLWHMARRDTIAQARLNISAHYDLGNEFFHAWLDPTMTYSSGMFAREDSTMLGASLKKIYALCEKLDLKPSDHLLEIGSGWGALAIFAASNYGCRVTTATISQNQFNYVRDEVARLGLDHLITPVFRDYRELTGQFDKIVSVEMIEAVGHHFLDTFFAKVSDLLKPDGVPRFRPLQFVIKPMTTRFGMWTLSSVIYFREVTSRR